MSWNFFVRTKWRIIFMESVCSPLGGLFWFKLWELDNSGTELAESLIKVGLRQWPYSHFSDSENHSGSLLPLLAKCIHVCVLYVLEYLLSHLVICKLLLYFFFLSLMPPALRHWSESLKSWELFVWCATSIPCRITF